MTKQNRISRRRTLQGVGVAGAAALLGTRAGGSEPGTQQGLGMPGRANPDIVKKVFETPLIDTHEHLLEEKERLAASHPRVQADDWSLLLSHYLNSDLLVAGMPQEAYDAFFSAKTDPADKWRYLEPYWPAVKNTGYGQAVRIAMQRIYDVDDLSAATVEKVQAGYEQTRRPGFYRHILCELGKIESCQVNCLSRPFCESEMPTLLMQDISIVGMFAGPGPQRFRQADRNRGPLAGRLAPGHRLVVRQVRQVRRGGQVAERLQPGHRLRAGPRREG